MLIMAFVVGSVLIRIKAEFTSFKTLAVNRFGNFLKIVKNFAFFFKVKIGKIQRNKKIAELHFKLACVNFQNIRINNKKHTFLRKVPLRGQSCFCRNYFNIASIGW